MACHVHSTAVSHVVPRSAIGRAIVIAAETRSARPVIGRHWLVAMLGLLLRGERETAILPCWVLRRQVFHVEAVKLSFIGGHPVRQAADHLNQWYHNARPGIARSRSQLGQSSWMQERKERVNEIRGVRYDRGNSVLSTCPLVASSSTCAWLMVGAGLRCANPAKPA